MENNIKEKENLFEKIENTIKEKKKNILVFFILLILASISLIFIDNSQKKKHEEISEKFIRAGLLLSTKKIDDSKNLYKEIVYSENKVYAILALNNIIENDLEKNSDEILKLFKIIENVKIDKEQKNLIKFKKALYLIKLSKNDEANKILQEIISADSIWKEMAIDLQKL